MNRQQAVLARLALSRGRLRGALSESSPLGAGHGVGALLGGLVQRHPWAAASLALVMGGLVTHLRPWRWLPRPAAWAAVWPVLWPALLPVLSPLLTAALAQATLGGWAGLLASLLRRAEAQASTATPPQAPPSQTAQPPQPSQPSA